MARNVQSVIVDFLSPCKTSPFPSRSVRFSAQSHALLTSFNGLPRRSNTNRSLCVTCSAWIQQALPQIVLSDDFGEVQG
jgi:hypothetical protein